MIKIEKKRNNMYTLIGVRSYKLKPKSFMSMLFVYFEPHGVLLFIHIILFQKTCLLPVTLCFSGCHQKHCSSGRRMWHEDTCEIKQTAEQFLKARMHYFCAFGHFQETKEISQMGTDKLNVLDKHRLSAGLIVFSQSS